jgi:hypothetical protein
MVVSPRTKELIESSSFDNRYGSSKGISEKQCDSDNILSQLFRRMHPSSCLGACSGDVVNCSILSSGHGNKNSSVTGSNLRSVVPDIMKAIDCQQKENNIHNSHGGRRRIIALKKLYELSSVKQNR